MCLECEGVCDETPENSGVFSLNRHPLESLCPPEHLCLVFRVPGVPDGPERRQRRRQSLPVPS
jgi:hypothetical protein